MKVILKQLMLLFVFTILLINISSIYALNLPYDPGYDENNVISTDIITQSNSYVATFVTLVQVISVATLVIMGIRYMLTSADGKADVKKGIVTWCIGAIIVFSATTLMGLVLNVITGKEYVNTESTTPIVSGSSSTGSGTSSGDNTETVDEDHWAKESWELARKEKLIPDSIKYNLGRNKAITRGQLFEVIFLACKHENVTLKPAEGVKYDVPDNLEFVVNELYGTGIIKGTSVNESTGVVAINHAATITRQDLATTIYRYLIAAGEKHSIVSTKTCKAPDIDTVASYAREAVCYLYNSGMMKGYDDKGTFGPTRTTTCEEAITLMNRVIGIEE